MQIFFSFNLENSLNFVVFHKKKNVELQSQAWDQDFTLLLLRIITMPTMTTMTMNITRTTPPPLKFVEMNTTKG